jgi:hypothetical protein
LGLSFRQCSDRLSARVEAERVRRVDDDLAFEPVRLPREHVLQRVEPEREDDCVGRSDRILHGGGACERTELVGECFRLCLIFRRQHDGLPAVDEMPCDCASDVADTDDCGCHL